MGIDIYAHWRGQTTAERRAQITGFSVTAGNVGYLREAYHGEPYATRYLCAEAFEAEGREAHIPASVLRERLPKTLAIVAERERTIYHSSAETVADVQASFTQFVQLCEVKERDTGEPVLILADC